MTQASSSPAGSSPPSSGGSRLPPTLRFLLTAAALIVVVAGMRAAEALLVPFLLSVFIAVIGAGPVLWLERKRVPPVAAVLLVVVALLAFGVILGTLVGASLSDFSVRLPAYKERLQEQTQAVLAWLNQVGIDTSAPALRDSLDPGAVMELVANVMKGLGGVLANAFLILLTVVFILLEVSSFPLKLRAALGDPQATFPRFAEVTDSINRYLALKTLLSLATGIAVALWVWALGVDFPVIWGLLAFLLNYVPNIGSFLAAIPAVLLTVVQFGLGRALVVAAGYVVVNVVIGNIIEPRMMGRGVGLSTLVVFLSLVFWGWVLGPVGMLLSVPLTMTVKIALETRDDTRWIAILLGSETSARAALPDPPKNS